MTLTPGRPPGAGRLPPPGRRRRSGERRGAWTGTPALPGWKTRTPGLPGQAQQRSTVVEVVKLFFLIRYWRFGKLGQNNHSCTVFTAQSYISGMAKSYPNVFWPLFSA
jgi:hypothetical protein